MGSKMAFTQITKLFRTLSWHLCFGIWLGMLASMPAEAKPSKQRPWAVVFTSQGSFVVELFYKRAPNTVAHFVGLAEGTKAWIHPTSKLTVRKPFYNNLTFHRIVPTYLLQTGCPLGNGKGGPGYNIRDEFHPTLKHSGPGFVSMANAGADTNGSQFFITLRATPWLDPKTVTGRYCKNFDLPVKCRTNQHCARYAKMFPNASDGDALCKVRKIRKGHSIFGKVIYGMKVVNRISEQPLDANGRPFRPIRIKQIKIRRGKKWKRSWLRSTSLRRKRRRKK